MRIRLPTLKRSVVLLFRSKLTKGAPLGAASARVPLPRVTALREDKERRPLAVTRVPGPFTALTRPGSPPAAAVGTCDPAHRILPEARPARITRRRWPPRS